MARIRTIKPEFPQSETVGALSRDARLLFIQLWTIADDEGRARAASRMLASLLYPYDDDARDLIDAWLDELEQKGCIRRYECEGATYLEIINWLKHQKIDHASKSKIPPFRDENANSRELSRTLAPDLGPRKGPLDGGGEDARAREPIVSSKAIDLAKQLAVIVGHDPEFVPPAWCGAAMTIQKWLTEQWPEELILETVKAVMAKKRDGPPATVTYFERPIATALARLKAPLPTVKIVETPAEIVHVERPQTSGSVLAAADRQLERMRGFDRPAPSQVDLRDGTIAAPLRAIPKR